MYFANLLIFYICFKSIPLCIVKEEYGESGDTPEKTVLDKHVDSGPKIFGLRNYKKVTSSDTRNVSFAWNSVERQRRTSKVNIHRSGSSMSFHQSASLYSKTTVCLSASLLFFFKVIYLAIYVLLPIRAAVCTHVEASQP